MESNNNYNNNNNNHNKIMLSPSKIHSTLIFGFLCALSFLVFILFSTSFFFYISLYCFVQLNDKEDILNQTQNENMIM